MRLIRERVLSRIVVALSGALLAVMTASPVSADPAPQTPAPAPTPAPTQLTQPSPASPGAVRPAAAPTESDPAAPNYLFPDVPAKALIHDGKAFWIKPMFAVVADYTWLSQDDASVEQVGKQENTPELRAGRVGVTLRSKGKLAWELFATADLQEKRTREGAVFQLYDLQFRLPLGPVKVVIGKQKETISYELSSLSVLVPQQERILLPFFPTRNIGVNFSGQLAGGRMLWALGAFNDWLETGEPFSENARDFVGRVSALAWESASKTDYVHLGIGWRNLGPDSGTMRFSGRPESNVTDKYVDTGDFSATRANELSLEALLAHGPYSVLLERFDAWTDAEQSGNPRFSGYYVTGSWVLTGESRQYMRAVGYAAGIVPKRRLGAVEIVGRYSNLGFKSGAIDGGVLDKWHVGVNWWASAQWKLGISYGYADLDKGGVRGKTEMVLARCQWLY
jgi:phosphate-selective porin OprO and OprP